MVPRELLVDGQDQHQRVFGHRDRVRAAVVGDWYARLARRLDVEPVVAGADQLDQLELRRPTVEVRPHVRAGEPGEVLRVLDGRVELGRALIDDLEVEICRQERAGDLDERRRKLRGEHDLDRHTLVSFT